MCFARRPPNQKLNARGMAETVCVCVRDRVHARLRSLYGGASDDSMPVASSENEKKCKSIAKVLQLQYRKHAEQNWFNMLTMKQTRTNTHTHGHTLDIYLHIQRERHTVVCIQRQRAAPVCCIAKQNISKAHDLLEFLSGWVGVLLSLQRYVFAYIIASVHYVRRSST